MIEVHTELVDTLERINDDPYEYGWMVRIRIADDSGLSVLMDHATYQKQCAEAG